MPRIVADRFELGALAGAGGMGEVYRAIDRATGDAVAVKLLRAEAQDHAARFTREARLLAGLAHPGIVRHVAHGYDPAGELWLAMEWLDGEDLATRLSRGALSVDETVALAAALADALGAAHAEGILHRDVKPSNVFLLGGDVRRPKLVDFGIARGGNITAIATTRAGAILGTPGYMSPEQARGDAGIDARADVFSLGCVLYECLSGREAFAGDHFVAVLAKVLFEEPEPLRDVPAWLAALVDRMLAKDPAARPRDAAAVAALLRGEARPDSGNNLARAPRLGDVEQRRLFVAVVRQQATSIGHDETAAPLPPDTADGVRIERLLDGTLVAAVSAGTSATDLAARAARLALRLRDGNPGAAVALATGSGVVGAFGPVVDRAARLASRTGAIVVDEATAGLVELRFVVERDGDRAILAAARETAEGARTLLGRPSPCVGREREVGNLVATLDECIAEGVARAVIVTAPPGTGKSRLRHELISRVAGGAHAVTVLVAEGDPMSASSAFALVGQMIRRAAGVREGEDDDTRRRKLLARTRRNVAAADAPRVAAFLGELAGVAFPDGDDAVLRAARRDPRLLATHTEKAWVTWLAAEARAAAIVVVVEDAHWGDGPSLQYVELALRRLAEAPLLVVAFARPELDPSLWKDRGSAVQRIELGALTRKASERLVRAVLPDADDATVARIVGLAGGNAFYLEELIRAVAGGAAELPESVLAMAQVRLEALEPDARALLRAASVFGDVFWESGVLHLLGGDERFRAWIDRLVERELVQPRADTRYAGERELIFRHALLREAAAATLTDADARVGHGLAAAWLEARGDGEAMALAEHWRRAGERARAATWYLHAAEDALRAGDLDAVLASVDSAHACGATGVAGKMLAIEALKWRGRSEDVVARAREVVAAEPPGSDMWCRAVAELAVAGRVIDLELLGRAEVATPAYVICMARVLTQACVVGKMTLVPPLLARFRGLATTSDPLLVPWIEQTEAFVAAAENRIDATVRRFEAAAAGFRAIADERNALAQDLDRSFALVEAGLYAEALALIAWIRATAEPLGLARVADVALCNHGIACFRLGDLDGALASLEQAVARMPASNIHVTYALMARSQLELARGDIAAADAAVRRAEATASSLWDLRSFVADVRLAQGRPADALVELDRPAVVATVLMNTEGGGMRMRRVRIQALASLGRTDEARAAAAAARDAVQALAAQIADDRMRASFLAAPENRQVLDLARDLVG